MPRHLAYPLMLAGGHLGTVEQDTPAEITGCCLAIVRHKAGDRWEDPTFGVPDATFTRGGALEGDLVSALDRWEPRAKPGVTVDVPLLAAAITAQVEV